MASSLPEAEKLLAAFKSAVAKKDYATAKKTLVQLKIKMTELPALPPLFQASPTAVQELTLARDALEHALLLDVATGDDDAFERDAAQLRPFYTDARPLLPPSPAEGGARGLTLLHLLASGRLAGFAAEAASLPADVAAAPTPALALRLEAALAEGAFPTALAAARAPLADPAAGRFVSALEGAIRAEVAACAAAAYPSLALKDAAGLLMLDGGEAAVAALAAEKGWAVRGGRVWFPRGGGAEDGGGGGGSIVGGPAGRKDGALPGPELLAQALTYARELERIV